MKRTLKKSRVIEITLFIENIASGRNTNSALENISISLRSTTELDTLRANSTVIILRIVRYGQAMPDGTAAWRDKTLTTAWPQPESFYELRSRHPGPIVGLWENLNHSRGPVLARVSLFVRRKLHGEEYFDSRNAHCLRDSCFPHFRTLLFDRKYYVKDTIAFIDDDLTVCVNSCNSR